LGSAAVDAVCDPITVRTMLCAIHLMQQPRPGIADPSQSNGNDYIQSPGPGEAASEETHMKEYATIYCMSYSSLVRRHDSCVLS
jgi:hypothetical protein